MTFSVTTRITLLFRRKSIFDLILERPLVATEALLTLISQTALCRQVEVLWSSRCTSNVRNEGKKPSTEASRQLNLSKLRGRDLVALGLALQIILISLAKCSVKQ